MSTSNGSEKTRTLQAFVACKSDANASSGPPTKRARVGLSKVISGGQTGADRAALEAAKEVALETGGTAPGGFLTARGRDKTLQSEFGLVELPAPRTAAGALQPLSVPQMYIMRSQINVDDSDATVAFRLRASVGTDKTIGYCATRKWRVAKQHEIHNTRNHYRPLLVVDSVQDEKAAVRAIVDFLKRTKPQTLNVCGHRDDRTAGCTAFGDTVKRILVGALTEIGKNKD